MSQSYFPASPDSAKKEAEEAKEAAKAKEAAEPKAAERARGSAEEKAAEEAKEEAKATAEHKAADEAREAAEERAAEDEARHAAEAAQKRAAELRRHAAQVEQKLTAEHAAEDAAEEAARAAAERSQRRVTEEAHQRAEDAARESAATEERERETAIDEVRAGVTETVVAETEAPVVVAADSAARARADDHALDPAQRRAVEAARLREAEAAWRLTQPSAQLAGERTAADERQVANPPPLGTRLPDVASSADAVDLAGSQLADALDPVGLVDVEPGDRNQLDSQEYRLIIEDAAAWFAQLLDLERKKTVSGEGMTSGHGDGKAENVELVQLPAGKAGHENNSHLFDGGEHGRYENSHTELQNAATAGAQATPSSKPVCATGRGWFGRYAEKERLPYAVADPEGVGVFGPDGFYDVIPYGDFSGPLGTGSDTDDPKSPAARDPRDALESEELVRFAFLSAGAELIDASAYVDPYEDDEQEDDEDDDWAVAPSRGGRR